MKHLLFSLILLNCICLPTYAMTSPPADSGTVKDYINSSQYSDKITNVAPNAALRLFRDSHNDLKTEDQLLLEFREGETADQYIKRIRNLNTQRLMEGGTPLPDPLVSTTQGPQPDNSSLNFQPNAPSIDAPMFTSTSLPQNQTLSTDNTFLNSIIPTSLFQGKPLTVLLNQIFYIGLIIAVILALVMIIRGGIQYMTTDASDGKTGAKNRIQAAVGGLVLAFSAVLILNTINPNLTNLGLNIQQVNISGINTGLGIGANDGGLTSGTRDPVTGALIPGTGTGQYNQAITPTSEGYTITPGRVAVDSDGINPPPYNDPTRQTQTSLPGLDANIDNYVVVPIGSTIPLGTKVKMYNENTQITAWGIVGDRGPTEKGYGEISLHAAKELGASDGTRDAASQHNITYTFYTNEKE